MHIYTEKIYRKPIDNIRINKNIIFRNRNKKSKKNKKALFKTRNDPR